MFSRIFTGLRNSLNAQTPRPTQGRMSLEDSSEEFVRATRTSIEESNNVRPSPIRIASTSSATTFSAALFGLSSNNTDDFIQKDLISTSLY